MAITSGNFYLSQEQMRGNAQYILDYLLSRGWTKQAICGVLGNMQRESTINPGIWQSLAAGNYSMGYGLVQWTPATNYTNWATQNGYAIGNMDGQLIWIDTLSASTGQWIQTTSYPLSWNAFKTSTSSPDYLASAFLANFERAGVSAEQERRDNAMNWFYSLDSSGSAGNSAIEKAVQGAISIANDNSHGYDQGSRWGNPDYDCSSLLITVWQNAGVPVKTNGATYTGNMYSVFTSCGFRDVTNTIYLSNGSGLQRGDVLLNHVSHTAMYIGDGQVVQASQNEFGGITGGKPGDQTGREIWVTGYYNYPWDCVLRYPGGGTGSGGVSGIYIVSFTPD